MADKESFVGSKESSTTPKNNITKVGRIRFLDIDVPSLLTKLIFAKGPSFAIYNTTFSAVFKIDP
jgi:hypothetical protein